MYISTFRNIHRHKIYTHIHICIYIPAYVYTCIYIYMYTYMYNSCDSQFWARRRVCEQSHGHDIVTHTLVTKEEFLFPPWMSDSALPTVEEGLRAITFTSHHHHGIVQKLTIIEIWTVVFAETKRDIINKAPPPTPPLFSCSRLRHYNK